MAGKIGIRDHGFVDDGFGISFSNSYHTLYYNNIPARITYHLSAN